MAVNHLYVRILLLIAASCPLAAAVAQDRAPESTEKTVHWPIFRGPGSLGVAEGYPTPTTWDVDKGEHLKWKTPIPGMGHGAPVIWGDRIYVITAVSGKGDDSLQVGLYGQIAPVDDTSEHEWRLMCLDKKTGKILWDEVVHKGVPTVKRHTKATQANSTPATDGRYVVTFYGSEGICCYTTDGKQVWKKSLAPLDSGYYVVPGAQWGFSSSPVIHGDHVIIQCDVQKDSYLAALNIKDGSEVWKTPRTDVPTWGTPALARVGDATHVIVNGYRHMGGYDAADGKEVWRMSGGGDIPVPTPQVVDGLVYLGSAHGGPRPLFAVKTSATGDISLAPDATSSDNVPWMDAGCAIYMQTPICYRGLLYACRDNGVLACYDAKTGEVQFRKRVGKGQTGITASAVAADGKIYYVDEEGTVYVLKAGPEFEVIATNTLGEYTLATPAISEGALFFRTQKSVIAIE